MSPAILGILTLTALWLTAWLSLQLHNHGVAGYLERRAETHVRRAAWLRAAAKWYRLFRVEGPRVFREIHSDELDASVLREVGR